MAFRPTANLIEGVIDNTTPGLVRGWIDFYRKGKEPLHCTLELNGDFHDDIRGHILHLWNDYPTDMGYNGSLGRIEAGFMDRMHALQRGKVGDITANQDGWIYIEWYSDRNGRVVLNLPQEDTEVLGEHVDLDKLPPRKSHPDMFNQYMRELSIVFRKQMKDPTTTVLILGSDGARTTDEKERN